MFRVDCRAMPPTSSRLPTSAELEILQVIWQRGPSTVREVYRTLAQEREIGYSTVLKFMQIMTDKGTLVRDETVRPQIYRPAQAAASGAAEASCRDLVARAFGGSPVSLVMQVLSDSRSSRTSGSRSARCSIRSRSRQRKKRMTLATLGWFVVHALWIGMRDRRRHGAGAGAARRSPRAAPPQPLAYAGLLLMVSPAPGARQARSTCSRRRHASR